MQFRVAVDEFLRFCALERQLSGHTLAAYRADLNDFGKWLPPRTRPAVGQQTAAVAGAVTTTAVADISPTTLKDYLEDMVGARRLSVATVRRRFACLRAFFRRAAARGGVADPFAEWRPLLPRRKRLPRTLSRSETKFLLAGRAANGAPRLKNKEAPFRLIVRLLVVTGMRVGELCRLRLDDVAPDGSVLRVHGKGARDRVAYVTDASLRRELRRIVDHRRRSAAGAGALFLNRHGAPLRPQSVRAKLKRMAKDAGLGRRVTPHMLRHTAATLLIETGVDIRFVQRLLGHSSIATTEIYTHVSDEALRRTLERADVLGALGSG
jgi:site-specific recombinase XerD